MSIRRVIQAMKRRGWKVDTRPYALNIVGIRSDGTVPNRFDDHLLVFFYDENRKLTGQSFPATTDPGTYWLHNPLVPAGTAILAEGQYENAYGIALHNRKYPALCQINRPVTVLRDYDRNSVLNFKSARRETGFFGINIHRANRTGTSYTVDRHSAGCQVFQSANHFALFMRLCERHRNRYGNRFTYTLIDQRHIGRRKLTGLLGGLLLVSGLAGAGFLLHQHISK